MCKGLVHPVSALLECATGNTEPVHLASKYTDEPELWQISSGVLSERNLRWSVYQVLRHRDVQCFWCEPQLGDSGLKAYDLHPLVELDLHIFPDPSAR